MGCITEKGFLIDFLYRDMTRIESFYSQLFSGNLKEVAVIKSHTSKSTDRLEGGIPVFSGGFSSEDSQSEKLENRVDPHDQKIIDILNLLNIPILNSSLSDTKNGQIVLVNGQITLRNYSLFKQVLPVFSDFVFSQYSGKGNKSQKREAKMFATILKILPMGLEVDIHMDNGEKLTGALKPEFLTQNQEDLLRIYGNNLPGRWSILGIIDSLQNDINHPLSDVKASVDQFGEAIKSLFEQENTTHCISPILIYRELSY